MNYDRIYSTVLLTTSLDSFVIVRQAPARWAVAVRLPAYHNETHVKTLSRHKRYYLLIPYSIFPIEENVSSIIDKFICTISFVQNNNTKVTPISHNITASGSTIVIFPCDFV